MAETDGNSGEEEMNVPSGTEETPSPPSPDNRESVAEARERFQSEIDAERQQQKEASAFKKKMQEARERQTVELELRGIPVEFQQLRGGLIDQVMDLADEFQQLDERAEEEEWSEERINRRAKEKIDELCDILLEHQTDSASREDWYDEFGRFGIARAAALLANESQSADMTEEELERFRRE